MKIVRWLLQDLDELPQPVRRDDQATGCQGIDILLSAFWRPAQAGTVAMDGPKHQPLVQLELLLQKGIGMDGLDPEAVQGVGREVLQVEGYDQLQSGVNGRGQYVAVLTSSSA